MNMDMASIHNKHGVDQDQAQDDLVSDQDQAQDDLEMIAYTDRNLFIQYCARFLTDDMARVLYNVYYVHMFSHKNKRTKYIYGDDPSRKYIIHWKNRPTAYNITQWNGALLQLKNKICAYFGIQLTVCVVQIYPNGCVGINKHRDKEMVPGTHIVGVSIGDTRVIQFARGSNAIDLPLPNGSLYILHPPTNDYWTHAINKKPESCRPRISFTFRDY